MASISTCQEPAFDFFQSTPQSQSSTLGQSPFNFDSSPYTDPAIFSDNSVLTSPTTPETPVFSDFAFPSQDKLSIKSEQPFDFGTFEDWMRWDEPSEGMSSTTGFIPGPKQEPLSSDMDRIELQEGVVPSNSRASDDVVFIEDPVSEEPMFQSPTTNNTEVPPRLYSTPLSWSRPSFGQIQQVGMLTFQEEMRLRDIAMPQSTRAPSYPTSPNSDYSPEPKESSRKKRKPSDEEDQEMEDEEETPRTTPRHPLKKTAHNMIEKRYRTNLNDKIAALRDSVPALRVVSKTHSKEDMEEDLQGLTPAHKLNKATVLSKATEYIAHLEKRNKHLARENAALKSRVDAFEILVMARQPQQPLCQQRNPMARQQNQNWIN